MCVDKGDPVDEETDWPWPKPRCCWLSTLAQLVRTADQPTETISEPKELVQPVLGPPILLLLHASAREESNGYARKPAGWVSLCRRVTKHFRDADKAWTGPIDSSVLIIWAKTQHREHSQIIHYLDENQYYNHYLFVHS